MKRLVPIDQIKENPDNPRTIKGFQFEKLVNSIKEFPKMMEVRPIIVDENMIVQGGNMRLKAHKHLGHSEIWVDDMEGWTEEEKKEFVIKDNVSFGNWDYDLLSQEYELDTLADYGLNVLYFEESDKVDEKEKGEIVRDMDLKFNEHHDYLVFIFNNSNDWVQAISQLGLEKQRVSLSPKTKKLGLGRVISSDVLLKLLKNEN
jgi:hypothetical protein